MESYQGRHPYVGYVVKRYPRFSETFIVNEILAHERAGMKIDIFALGHVDETHFQDVIAKVRAPVTRFDDKQRNTDNLWALLNLAGREIPGFTARQAALQHYNVHEFAQATQLALAIRARGIQHLHAHFGTRATTVARLAAVLSGISYSFTAHAKDIYYPYKESTELALKLRDAAHAVTVSEYNLAYLREQYGHDANNVARLYNGIDLSIFRYSSPTQNTPAHILAVGRLVEKKGFPLLIEALHKLRLHHLPFRCTLIGDGPLREVLQQQIHAAGLSAQVTLPGLLPQAAIIDAMRSATLLAAPCIISEEGDRDGLPTVLLEAMALGTPVISTAVAGIPELVINRETGLCVPPQDSDALADAMARLIADAPLRQRLSEQARRLIEREFDIDSNAALLRNLFAGAVAERRDGEGSL